VLPSDSAGRAAHHTSAPHQAKLLSARCGYGALPSLSANTP
jgi:hypothetical protein